MASAEEKSDGSGASLLKKEWSQVTDYGEKRTNFFFKNEARNLTF